MTMNPKNTMRTKKEPQRHDFIEGNGGLCRRCGCGPLWYIHTAERRPVMT